MERTVVAKLNEVAEIDPAVTQLSLCFFSSRYLLGTMFPIRTLFVFFICFFLDELQLRNQLFIINANQYTLKVATLNLR